MLVKMFEGYCMIPAYKIKVSMNSSIHVTKLPTLKHCQSKCEIHTENADQDNLETNSIGLSARKYFSSKYFRYSK